MRALFTVMTSNALAGPARSDVRAPGRRGRARRVLTSLLAPLLAGLLVPTLAAAEWTAPDDLSGAGRDALAPALAVDADGDAVFVWERSDGQNVRIQAQARSAAGLLSPVKTLSESGQDAHNPQVAVDADGDAVVTWKRYDGTNQRIQARSRSAAGALSGVQNLSEAGQHAFDPQVAVDADGDAVFTWRRSDGTNSRIQARSRSAAGALSAVKTLSRSGQNADKPQVAVDDDGDAVFTWQRSDGANLRAQARARSAAGVLSAVQTLSAAGQSAFDPQVGVDPDGDAVFTWWRSDGTSSRIQAQARSAAGAMSAVQSISDPGQDARDPQVGVDADGDSVLTWERSDGTNSRIQARSRSAGGALGAVQSISDPGQDAFDPQVGVDADGDTVLTWTRDDGADSRVQARSRSAAGTLRPFTVLSDPGQEAVVPHIGVDADGDAVVTWARRDGSSFPCCFRVQASAGP